jgi:hypothetical protein
MHLWRFKNSEKENNSTNTESHPKTLIGGKKQHHGLLCEYHHWQDTSMDTHNFLCITTPFKQL